MPFSEAVAINPKRKLPKEGLVPFLDMATLPLNGADVSVLTTREVGSGGSKFQSGDTLFARITPCAENGKLGFVQSIDGGQVAQGSTEFIVMAGRDGLTLPEYVSYLAGWSEVRDQAIGLMEGTSGRQRVPSWAFDEIEVLVPPRDEQRRIAEVLRSVDEAIARELAVLGQYQAAYDSTMSAFLATGNDTDNGVPTDEWITGRVKAVRRILKSWRITRLVEVAKLESGHTPSRTVEAYWEGGDIGWISLHDTKNLERREIQETALKITAAGVANSSARMLPQGTVCLSRTATVGKCVIMGKPMTTSQDFANFVCSPALNNRYLLHLFRCMGPIWKALSSGSTHKTIYMPTFEALQIVVPPIEEQESVAAALDAIASAIELSSEHLESLRELRRSISSDLLSGRVRVPA